MEKEEGTNQIVTLIEGSVLEQETKVALRSAFEPFIKQAAEWKERAEQIVVTDDSQVAVMKMAREARLAVKDIRISIDKRRKELKEDSLRKGKFIDQVASTLTLLIEPIEEHLEKQEKYSQIKREAERKRLEFERTQALLPYNIEIGFYDLGSMPQDIFDKILARTQKEHQEELARQEAEQKLVEQRKKEEADRLAAQAVENERLKKEAAEREKLLAETRQREAAERKKLEDARQKEKAEMQKKLDKERQEKEAAEKLLKQKQKEEADRIALLEKEQKEKAKALKKAAAAPDKKKLEQFALDIINIHLPELKDGDAIKIADNARVLLLKVNKYILDQIKEL